MLQLVNTALNTFDDLVWGVPLIVLILATGIYLTIRLKGMQILRLPAALRYMVQNEEEGHGEVTSFGALCTAMSATIGTGNIVGVATAIVAGADRYGFTNHCPLYGNFLCSCLCFDFDCKRTKGTGGL